MDPHEECASAGSVAAGSGGGRRIACSNPSLPSPPHSIRTHDGPPPPRKRDLSRDPTLPPREPLDQPAEAPPPGIRRIGPNNRVQVPPPPPPAPPVRVNPPSVPLPNPERPADNPRDEYARLVKLG